MSSFSEEVRSWRLHRWSNATMREIARFINPKVAGWMAYYGVFYRSALYPALQRINAYLVRWMRRKYKRLRPKRKALETWWRLVTQYPGSFSHWKWTVNPWRTG